MKILSLLIFYTVLFSSFRQTDSPHGSDFKIACSTCHSSKGWTLDKTIYSFDHNKTILPLVGQHKEINCRQCHITLVFKEAKSECNQCHNDIHQATVGSDCSRCHTPASWLVNNINEIHQLSRFPLIGAHRTADCYQCHKSESFVRFDVPGVECINCHRQEYMATTNPNHIESGLPEDCIQCHPIQSTQWTGAAFDHSFFPLNQGHSDLNCTQCHTTGKYSDAKPDCYSCHEQDYMASKEPDHNASGISHTCTDCHTLSPGWKPTTFDHSSFPLTLGHAVPTCADCHIGGNYTTTPIDCYACHQKDFMATTDPNHQESAFSITCTDCHTTNPGWKPTTIDHSSFPLTLGHSVPTCSDCHIGGNYTTTPIDCYACHQKDFQTSAEPDHQAAAFSITCTDCHTTNPGWKPTSFSHNFFPLTLGHSVPKCSDCHTGGNYSSTPIDCYACHQQDYQSTTEPNHSTSGFSQTCTDCHSTNPGWKPTTFDHSSFPLTLGHSVPVCSDCHIGGNYTTTPTDCYACHQQDYQSTSEPNHSASGFSHTCTDCHSTNPGWKPTTFDHSSFPLTLGHSVPVCSDCHIGGNYTTTPTDCYACHKQDFQATTDPNHQLAAFSTTCTDCHSTNPGWKPTTFDHSSFQLTLGHSIPTCNDCHKGNYTSTSPDCYSCHQQDYLSTTDPNHSASGFSHTCADCHSTNPGWKPATFDHSSFPLTQGHAVPTCNDCHKGNYTTTPTDCYSCHQQDYMSTTDPNHSASGFSHTCTDCHSTSPGWKPATFNHTSFPLTLGHSVPTCNDCHKGNYTSTPIDCYACHQADYNGSINPNHQSLGFSTTCKLCHSTNPDWKPATYREHDTRFPIYSGRHQGTWSACTDCHTNPSNYSSYSCIICHEHNKTDMDNVHQGEVSGYSWVSTECFRCHPRGTAGGG